VRALAQHPLAVGCGRVAGPQPHPDRRQRDSAFLSQRADLVKRTLQILVNIVAQRLERRTVDNLRLVWQFARACAADQAIDANQERSQRLARSRRSGNENVVSGTDDGPTAHLALRGHTEAFKPFLDERVEGRQHCFSLPRR